MGRFLWLGALIVALGIFGFTSSAQAQPAAEDEPTWSLAGVTVAGQAMAGVPAVAGSGLHPVAVRPKSSEITVTYHNAPANVQAAVDRAAETWEGLLVASAEIRVDVTWEAFDANLLGQSNVASVSKGPADVHLPTAGVLYPAALANALRGSRASDTRDMAIRLNSVQNWYLGLDGAVPTGKYDLVSVALHEIAHGLGIDSELFVTHGLGTTDQGHLPTVFDTFLADYRGVRLTSMLGADPVSLANAAQGGRVVFAGGAATVAAGGAAPVLHTPEPFQAGSSLTHLNPAEYGVPSTNAMLSAWMVPGWALHDPGPIALAMLHDLGWTISGVGEPARLAIARLPASVPGNSIGRLDLLVRVEDTIGQPIRSDDSTVVELSWFRTSGTSQGTCTGEASGTKRVSGGVVAFRGCTVGGYGWAWYLVEAPGLVPGRSNPVAFSRPAPFAIMLTRDR